MKKSNVILQAAIASALLTMVGSASAGTLTGTGTVYAAENFKSGATNITLPKTVAQMITTYSFGASTTLNPASTIVLTLRLTNGAFVAAPAVGDFKVGGVTATAAATSTAAGVVTTISADKSTITATFTSMTGSSTTLGLGGITYTPTINSITATNSALAVAGANLTAAAAITLTTPTYGTFEATSAMPATVDAPAPSGVAIASSAQAVTVSLDSIMSGYGAKIDLTASPIKSNYTNAAGLAFSSGGVAVSGMALGGVVFTNAAATQPINLTTTGGAYSAAWDSSSTAHTATIDVTPGAGQSFPIGSQLYYSLVNNTCAAAQNGVLTAFTASTASSKATLTVSAAALTAISTASATTEVWVCMTAPSSGNTAAPITATLTGTLVPTATADASPTITGLGYPVVYNGSQYDVRNYVPAAATGFNTFVRVINTGTIAAPISIALIDDATGTVGTAKVIIASLPVGAASILTPTQIENATTGVGAVAGTSRPRLRITAPTNGINVQTYLFGPGGVFADMTGAQ